MTFKSILNSFCLILVWYALTPIYRMDPLLDVPHHSKTRTDQRLDRSSLLILLPMRNGGTGVYRILPKLTVDHGNIPVVIFFYLEFPTFPEGKQPLLTVAHGCSRLLTVCTLFSVRANPDLMQWDTVSYREIPWASRWDSVSFRVLLGKKPWASVGFSVSFRELPWTSVSFSVSFREFLMRCWARNYNPSDHLIRGLFNILFDQSRYG